MSDTGSETVSSAIRELVDANHILFDQGVVDGFGHVSVRHPVRPDRFLLARSMAPGLVTMQDVLEFDLTGLRSRRGRRIWSDLSIARSPQTAGRGCRRA